MISSHGEAMSTVAVRCLRAKSRGKIDGFYIGDEDTDEAVKLADDAPKESEKATSRGSRGMRAGRKEFMDAGQAFAREIPQTGGQPLFRVLREIHSFAGILQPGAAETNPNSEECKGTTNQSL